MVCTKEMNMSRLRNSGFSLIELLISITIGLLIVAGVTLLIARTSASRSELETANRQIESGRYAYEVIAHDLRHAGYYGLVPATKTASVIAPDVCATAVGTIANSLSFPIQGISDYGIGNPEAVRAAIFSCLPAAAILGGTDVLAIRRVATDTSALSALELNTAYVQSGFAPDGTVGNKHKTQVVVALSSDLAAFSAKVKKTGTGGSGASLPVYTTPAPVHRYIVRIYFISPCSEPVLICPAGSTQLPTLKRMELGTGPAFPATVEVIAEGIEDFQVDYGVNTNTTGAYLDGMPNQWSECTPTSSTTYDDECVWQDVVAAKIYLLARNSETSPGYTDTRRYRLGERDTKGSRVPKPATNDNYKRHLYSGLVRLNNIGMNRECTPTSTDPC